MGESKLQDLNGQETGKTNKGHKNKPCRSSRRNDDPSELVSKQECLKSIREFNRQTARYCCLVPALGSSIDTLLLRQELKMTWKKAHELAHQNKRKLLPHLKGHLCKIDEVEEYEKLWTTFGSCLENLQSQMWKTLSIITGFQLEGDLRIFIRTGQLDAIPAHRSFGSAQPVAHSSIAVEPLDGIHNLESPEATFSHTLQQDICDISAMLQEIQEIVDVKPWTIEPEINTSKILERTNSLHSEANSENSTTQEAAINMVSVFSGLRHRRKKCICTALILVFALTTVATIVGVCISLL